MSTLVVLLPARRRHQAGDPRPDFVGEFGFVLTNDGSTASQVGQCALALLPKADNLILALHDHDTSWHQITIPKAPTAKLRGALLGTMEEQMLDDADDLHLALEPGAAAGQEHWVCAVNKKWLQAEIARFEEAGLPVERVVPMSWPEDSQLGHFSESSNGHRAGEGQAMQLTWSDANGVATVQLAGSLAKSLLPQWSAAPARWTAHPAIAAQAERWLGATVLALRDEMRALQAMRSLWNLRQFDLTASNRGTLALRDGWKRFLSPDWRPVRWGVAALVLLQLGGLNLWSWHLNRSVDNKKAAMSALLLDAHPHVKLVADAPAQMLKETEALRAAAGRPGDADLESALSALATAWPEGRGPLDTIRYEGGKLSLSSSGWTEPQVDQLRSALRPAGWAVETAQGAIAITRARPGNTTVASLKP